MEAYSFLKFRTPALLVLLAIAASADPGYDQSDDEALAPVATSMEEDQGRRLKSSEEEYWTIGMIQYQPPKCLASFAKADITKTRRSDQPCGFPENATCPCDTTPYRQFSGACNNPRNAGLGAATSLYNRVLRARYADGVNQVVTRTPSGRLPKARVVSANLYKDKDRKDKLYTLMLMQWGQLIAHDVGMREDIADVMGQMINCCDRSEPTTAQPEVTVDSREDWGSKEDENHVCMPIRITRDDPFFSEFNSKCINLMRSQFSVCGISTAPAPTPPSALPAEELAAIEEEKKIWHKGRHPPSPKSAQQLNMVSHFLDLSNLYGSSNKENQELRLGTGGLLKSREVRGEPEWHSSADDSSAMSSTEVEVREFLPLSNVTVDGCDTNKHICYKAGDRRVNQHPWLASMQTVLLREHNRVATGLRNLRSDWGDERLFQEARRIVIAQFQLITYRDYLPKIVGKKILDRMGMVISPGEMPNYSTYINPSTLNEFSQGAFRFLHSQMEGTMKLLGHGRNAVLKLRLGVHYNDPSVMELDHYFEAILRGLSYQPAQQTDRFVTKELTTGSMDLVSENIKRGRDHGLPSYNAMRDMCGLRKAVDFDDFRDVMTDKNIRILKHIYRSVNDVDLYVGGTLEEHCVDEDDKALVGPTFGCIIAEQFYRWRIGDRYFFDHKMGPGAFTEDQYRAIHDVTLASILCANLGDEKYMQLDPFMRLSIDNNLRQCMDIPTLNLTAWKDYQPPEACTPPTTEPPPAPPVPQGYETVPGVGFYKFYGDRVNTFYDAAAVCNNDGAHLAIINSEKECQALMDIFAKHTNVKSDHAYIGFHDMAEEGNYVTIFGQPLNETGFFRWAEGEPNNFFGNEDCGAIHRNGGLNDLFCAENGPHNLICEYEPYWKQSPKP